MQVNLFTITLKEAFMLSPKVKHFRFEADLPVFDFQPGQFITIHFETKEGKALKRSYSLANSPLKTNLIEFAAGYVEYGPGTELLFSLKPGDKLNINGPFGRLILKEEHPKRYIFVATSTGVTPYRSMLVKLKANLDLDPHLKVVFLLGVQNSTEALYSEEFLKFSKIYPERVTFKVQLSRPESSSLEAYQAKGYVQHTFPGLALNPAEDIVYLCGNPAMIDESFEELKNRGFTLQQIIREKYISGR